MGGKHVKVAVLAVLIARSACSTTAKFKKSSPLAVTYEDKLTKSAVNRFACLALCNEGCRFVEYSNSGPESDACGLYYLKDDAMYGSLKILQIASGYIKIYPNEKVFIGMPDHLDWNQSKQNCESFGWKLATAESSSLFDRTKTLMQNGDYWLGATKESGEWRWLSGVPMSPLPVENDPVENPGICLFIWLGALDDGLCTYKAMHVCEM